MIIRSIESLRVVALFPGFRSRLPIAFHCIPRPAMPGTHVSASFMDEVWVFPGTTYGSLKWGKEGQDSGSVAGSIAAVLYSTPSQ